MLLSQIADKSLSYSQTQRGVCVAVGVSMKNGACKYLHCLAQAQPQTEFSLNFSALSKYDEFSLYLASLRPVVTKQHVRLALHLPIFSYEGKSFGTLLDAEIENGIVVALKTSEGKSIPFTSVYAISDAIILQKNKPYPIGQRIPAPIVKHFSEKNEPIVTRSVLQAALRKKSLIKLTLSLPPFSMTMR